jgi:hypothetical protein
MLINSAEPGQKRRKDSNKNPEHEENGNVEVDNDDLLLPLAKIGTGENNRISRYGAKCCEITSAR